MSQLTKLLRFPQSQVIIYGFSCSQYCIKVRQGDRESILTNWRRQTKVFTSLSQAKNFLRRHGVKRAYLQQTLPQAEVMGSAQASVEQAAGELGIPLVIKRSR